MDGNQPTDQWTVSNQVLGTKVWHFLEAERSTVATCFAMVAVVWYQHEMIVSILYLAMPMLICFILVFFKSAYLVIA